MMIVFCSPHSAAAVAGIVVAGIVVAGIFAVGVGVSLICKYKKKQDPANKQGTLGYKTTLHTAI